MIENRYKQLNNLKEFYNKQHKCNWNNNNNNDNDNDNDILYNCYKPKLWFNDSNDYDDDDIDNNQINQLTNLLESMHYVNGLDVAQSMVTEVSNIYNDTQTNWELVSEENDCLVYSAQVSKDLIHFKCVGYIDRPADEVWNVLYNPENQERWDTFCFKSKVIEQMDSLNIINFQGFGSPLGGTPRYFCLFRTSHIDIKNRRYWNLIQSINHPGADTMIKNMDGAAFFTELRATGWIVEDVSPTRCRVLFISQIDDDNLLPFIQLDRLEYYRKLYKETAFHCLFKISNLRDFVMNQSQQEMPQYAEGEIFKQVSDTIGSVDSSGSGWTLFRKHSDIEFYCRDYHKNPESDAPFDRYIMDDVEVIDIITSGYFNVEASLETIESFIISTNTPLIDSWTYVCEDYKIIDDKSSIIAMKFRTLLSPNVELCHYMLKQRLHLPLNITFIGCKSIDYENQSTDIWFGPTGYFILPLEKGWSVRYLLHIKIQVPKKMQICKKKLLLSISERLCFTYTSMKHHMSRGEGLSHIRWDQVQDKSVDEVLDMFFKMAIDEIDKKSTIDNIKSKEEFYKQVIELPTNENIENKLEEKKRKRIENGVGGGGDGKPIISSTSTSFCFIRPNPNSHRLPPAPFTPDWDKRVRRRPFLLLVSNSRRTLTAPQKSPRYNTFNTNSLFDILPEEIVQYTFSFLDASDLARISMTCKIFYDTATSDHLWKALFDCKFKLSMTLMFDNHLSSSSSFNNINNNNNLLNNSSSSTSSSTTSSTSTSPTCSSSELKSPPFTTSEIVIQSPPELSIDGDTSLQLSPRGESWRKLYIAQETIETNWRKAKYRVSYLQGHGNKRINVLQYGPEFAITAGRDKEMRMWNMGTKQCTQSLKHSNSTVVSFEKDCIAKTNTEIFPYCLSHTNQLRIGAANGMVVRYNLGTHQVDKQYRFVYLADGYIFHRTNVYVWESTSVQMWNEDTNQRIFHISTNRAKINMCRLSIWQSNHVYAACGDKTLKMWDQSTFQQSQSEVPLQPNQVPLQQHQQNNQPPTMTFSGHSAAVNCFDFFGDNYIVTGSNDRSIRLWDVRKPDVAIQTVSGVHQSHIRSLKVISNQKLVSGDDSSLQLWTLTDGLTKHSCQIDKFEHNGLSCFELDDESILAGFNNGVVKYYDFTI